MVKSLITLTHGGKLKYRGDLPRVLTRENVGTAVNCRGIFITLAPKLAIFLHFLTCYL
jgi:hypothetical protein